jgi:pimeloyl-ACP methyl ester carboxylesterase
VESLRATEKYGKTRNRPAHTVVPISQADVLAREIPKTGKLIIEGARHPCYLDNPDLFHREMISFLKSLKDN